MTTLKTALLLLLTTLWTACDSSAHAREITELPEGTAFYLHDERGNPTVTLDRNGNVVDEPAYHSYGSERRPSLHLEPWAFAGNEQDLTGIAHFHARPYDARLGRFLSVDPEPLFNPNTNLDPRAFQAYSYAAGDPINQQDATGRSIWTKLVKFGVKLYKTGDLAQTVYGIAEDGVTLFDPKASAVDRAVAGVSLASELAPLSIGDVKDAAKAIGALRSAGKKADSAADAAKGLRAGAAGRHADLVKAGRVGDGLTPHHMPQAAQGFTSTAAGGSLVLSHAEHALTRTYGAAGRATLRAEKGMPFRDVLARDIRDIRANFGSKYDQGIRDLLTYYRDSFPNLIGK
jgi:RHS repeat-associated protein